MRILILSFPSQKTSIGGEDQIAQTLLYEFASLGHSAFICNRDNYDHNEEYNYDLIFSLNHPIQIMQKRKSVWATWLFNENIGQTIDEISNNSYDVFFVNSKFIESQLSAMGHDSVFMPFPSFDYYFRKEPLIHPDNKKTDIIYLGNYNPEYKSFDKINNYLLPCLNYSFEIYGGEKWLFNEQKKLYNKGIFQAENFCEAYEYYYKGIFPIEQCSKISDYSKIFINFNSPGQINLQMINNRIFDLLSNGCFVITDDDSNQKEEFGDCVEYSCGGEDLKNKIDYYLSNHDLIFEKQKKALEFANKRIKKISYAESAKKITDYITKNEERIINERKSRKVLFAIIVNNMALLGNCIRSIPKEKFDQVKYRFYVSRSNRIHATKIISNNFSEKDYEIVIIDCDPLKYRISYSDIDFKNIVIPTYSNIIYPEIFCKNIYTIFQENEYCDIIKFPVIDCSDFQKKVFGINGDKMCSDINIDHFVPYGFYAVNYRNKLSMKNSTIDWEDLSKENEIESVEYSPSIIFETESQRKEFISNSYEEVIKILSKPGNKKETDSLGTNKINVQTLRFSILSFKEVQTLYQNIENIIISNSNMEEVIRKLESHYTVICPKELNFDLQSVADIIISHMNYDSFLVGDSLFIKTVLLYQCCPSNDLVELGNSILSNNQYSLIKINHKTFDINIFNSDNFIPKKETGLKVAVLSMCGVSSYEDRYGIGGEHQVVHWLKTSFEKREDVYLCHIFDTYNYDLMDPDEYDIIFSNSCWRSLEFKRKRSDNLTIFWHFNMDSGKATVDTVLRLNYDIIWTNSYVGYDYFKSKDARCMMKQLNASSQYHYPYPYKSSLYSGDVVYVGGYQVHYKGKELIDKFIKPCCGKDFDFAIYGNRLWKAEVQKQALSTDSCFKDEYYDESFEPHYKKILPMQDFNILAKNTKIWVNFNAMTQRGMQMNNDRVIWGLACGAFFITDDTKEARRFYQNQNPEECPVVFSKGEDDLVEKIRYYLDHEEERAEISSRGPSFIKKNKLYTDDTVNQIIDLYYKRNQYESKL